MKNAKNRGIENTLAALEEAIKHKKEQLHNAQIQGSPSPIVPQLFSEILNRAGGSYAQAANALENSSVFVRNFIMTAQQNIQDRPWEVLRRVAVYSFGIGLFLSFRHRKPPMKGKR